ncbi:hypothetical protein Dimus_006608 [Dionaea muscipula]
MSAQGFADEVILPELELDLVPTEKGPRWADLADFDKVEGLRASVQGPKIPKVEEGEFLISPCSGEIPSGVEGSAHSVKMHCLGEIQFGDFEDGLNLRTMVDSVLQEDPSTFPRKPWIELFANNRKPCTNHMLTKSEIDVPVLSNDSIDLSNGFELGLFDEPPPCLIAYPLGRCPSYASLRGLTASWGFSVEFQSL